MTWSISDGANYNFTIVFNFNPIPDPILTCHGCSQPNPTMQDQIGRLWHPPCLEEDNRRGAVANAPEWIAAAFYATKREQRARLYKMLAAAFHPDQGGDPALMVALNAVRERFPS